jgi:hypothetical protein
MAIGRAMPTTKPVGSQAETATPSATPSAPRARRKGLADLGSMATHWARHAQTDPPSWRPTPMASPMASYMEGPIEAMAGAARGGFEGVALFSG